MNWRLLEVGLSWMGVCGDRWRGGGGAQVLSQQWHLLRFSGLPGGSREHNDSHCFSLSPKGSQVRHVTRAPGCLFTGVIRSWGGWASSRQRDRVRFLLICLWAIHPFSITGRRRCCGSLFQLSFGARTGCQVIAGPGRMICSHTYGQYRVSKVPLVIVIEAWWLSLQPSCSEVTALVCFTCSPLACVFTVVCISLRSAPVCMDRNTRDPASTSCLLSNQCLYFLWWLQFHCHSLVVVLFWCFSFLIVIFGFSSLWVWIAMQLLSFVSAKVFFFFV